jgi:hypothetical protein
MKAAIYLPDLFFIYKYIKGIENLLNLLLESLKFGQVSLRIIALTYALK